MRRVVTALASIALAACSGSSSVETLDEATTAVAPSSTAPSSTAPSSTAPVDPGAPGTSEPSSSSTPAASTTPPETTAAASTTVAPTSAPPLPSTPTAETVLVYAGGPGAVAWQRLGAWDVDHWVDLADDEVFPRAPTVDRVSVSSVDLPAVATDVASTPSDYACIDLPMHVGIDPDVSLPESPLGWGYGAIAVDADWPLQPRPVRAVGLDNEVYQTVGERLLGGRPDIEPSDGDVVQVLRVDLDGDGTEEVLVSFRYVSAPDFGAVGDFSIVYVRQVVPGGAVRDEIVFEYLVPDSPDFPAPGSGSVAAVADLNGDGAMEVAIRSSFWEYAMVEILELRDGALVPVMSGGCGV